MYTKLSMRQFRPVLKTFRLMSSSALEPSVNGICRSTVINLNDGQSIDAHAQRAATALKSGHVISVPTDTIYGVAALAQNKAAVESIYEIKKRNAAKPLAICVSEVDEVYLWGEVTVPYELLTSLLPGPVTVVFKRTPLLNSSLNPGTELVGIRIPDHKFIKTVARYCGAPIALTSANISSQESPLNVSEFQELWNQLHLVFDGGCLGKSSSCREGSTVVDLSEPGSCRLIRRGSAYKQTVDILKRFELCIVD